MLRLTDEEWRQIEPTDEKLATLEVCSLHVIAHHLSKSDDYCTFQFTRHFIQRPE